MKLPKLTQPASPFPPTLYVKPPDPLGEFKKSFGLLGTPWGFWGKQKRYDPMSRGRS
jgi:hypothetical protein